MDLDSLAGASGLYLHGSIFPFSVATAGWKLNFDAMCATSKSASGLLI